MSIDPRVGLFEPAPTEREDVPAALDPTRDQPGLLEHPQVTRNRGLSGVEKRAQLSRSTALSAQRREHAPPRGISQRVEDAIQWLKILYSHMAIYNSRAKPVNRNC